MIPRSLAAGVVALVLLAGCGDDGGGGSSEEDLVQLLQDEAHQPASIASCVTERVLADDDVDRDELEAIIRGEGTEDVDTSNAYADAALACAQEHAGDPNAPTVP